MTWGGHGLFVAGAASDSIFTHSLCRDVFSSVSHISKESIINTSLYTPVPDCRSNAHTRHTRERSRASFASTPRMSPQAMP